MAKGCPVQSKSTGAAVTEWSDCSPPTKANQVQSLDGSPQIFASGNRAGRCRWSAGFLGDLPFSLPLHSGAASFTPHFTLIGSQDLSADCIRQQDGGRNRRGGGDGERRELTTRSKCRVTCLAGRTSSRRSTAGCSTGRGARRPSSRAAACAWPATTINTTTHVNTGVPRPAKQLSRRAETLSTLQRFKNKGGGGEGPSITLRAGCCLPGRRGCNKGRCFGVRGQRLHDNMHTVRSKNTTARLHLRGSKFDPRTDLRLTQKTVAPFEFRVGLEIEMSSFRTAEIGGSKSRSEISSYRRQTLHFHDVIYYEPIAKSVSYLISISHFVTKIDESKIQNHAISLVQHFYIGTKIKLDPNSELGSFDLGSGKMLVQPGIRLLASHPGKPGPIPDGIAPGFSHVGMVPHDAAGRLVFSGVSRFLHPCIPALLRSPRFTLIGSQDPRPLYSFTPFGQTTIATKPNHSFKRLLRLFLRRESCLGSLTIPSLGKHEGAIAAANLGARLADPDGQDYVVPFARTRRNRAQCSDIRTVRETIMKAIPIPRRGASGYTLRRFTFAPSCKRCTNACADGERELEKERTRERVERGNERKRGEREREKEGGEGSRERMRGTREDERERKEEGEREREEEGEGEREKEGGNERKRDERKRERAERKRKKGRMDRELCYRVNTSTKTNGMAASLMSVYSLSDCLREALGTDLVSDWLLRTTHEDCYETNWPEDFNWRRSI
ncbi:hypothetical protein PR048_029056 [Dryococelus australis]|uniref:Uncharacterized protein n=1 Tax=Dryococelus australis TaxID=614101 RepID=A0ABQ9GCA6_9NEOP|nr:hypothetical protein PR048_029056 [Dryococelus australis]